MIVCSKALFFKYKSNLCSLSRWLERHTHTHTVRANIDKIKYLKKTDCMLFYTMAYMPFLYALSEWYWNCLGLSAHFCCFPCVGFTCTRSMHCSADVHDKVIQITWCTERPSTRRISALKPLEQGQSGNSLAHFRANLALYTLFCSIKKWKITPSNTITRAQLKWQTFSVWHGSLAHYRV